MLHTSATSRTLRNAALTLGGAQRLAEYLAVPLADLERWMLGEEAPPTGVFLAALDVVADGPYSPPTR